MQELMIDLLINDYFWWVNANMDGGTVGLFALNALDVQNVSASVALQHFAGLRAFVVASDDLEDEE